MGDGDGSDWGNADRQAAYRRRRREAGWVEYRQWLPPAVAAQVRAFAGQLLADLDADAAPGRPAPPADEDEDDWLA